MIRLHSSGSEWYRGGGRLKGTGGAGGAETAGTGTGKSSVIGVRRRGGEGGDGVDVDSAVAIVGCCG